MDLLFLAHRAPWPPDRGDRIRSWHVLKHLARQHRIHLVAFVDEAAKMVPAPELTAVTASCTLVHRRKSRGRALAEALVTGRAVSMTAFADPRFARAVAQAHAAHPIGATYAFSGQMAQYLPAEAQPVMDLVDVDSAKFAQLSASSHGPLAWLYAREARLLGAVERDVATRADATLFVSEAEAALFREAGGAGRILAVENGIDAGVFDPASFAPPSESLVVMTGQMDYAPNVEGAAWLVERVLPLLRETHPEAQVAIVGRAPVPAVKALAQRPGVIVTGEVADVRPWLARASVAAAPLQLARGIQNKVFEAMAMERPVVATSAAAEGIDHAGTLRTADDPASFARALAQVLSDRQAAEALGRAARARVLERYEWSARLALLDTLFA